MNAKGLTLLELLIVVAIVGILGALTVPAMGRYFEQERLRGALLSLKQELVYARSEAIRRHKDVYIVVSAGPAWCVGISLQENCDCALYDPAQSASCTVVSNGVPVLRRLAGENYPGVTLDRALDFRFNGFRGLPYRQGSFSGTLRLNSGIYSGRVVISRIGRIKACADILGMEAC